MRTLMPKVDSMTISWKYEETVCANINITEYKYGETIDEGKKITYQGPEAKVPP